MGTRQPRGKKRTTPMTSRVRDWNCQSTFGQSCGAPYFAFPCRLKSKAASEQMSPTPSTRTVKSEPNRTMAPGEQRNAHDRHAGPS